MKETIFCESSDGKILQIGGDEKTAVKKLSSFNKKNSRQAFLEKFDAEVSFENLSEEFLEKFPEINKKNWEEFPIDYISDFQDSERF